MKVVRPKSRFSDPLSRLSAVVRKLTPPSLPRQTSNSNFFIFFSFTMNLKLLFAYVIFKKTTKKQRISPPFGERGWLNVLHECPQEALSRIPSNSASYVFLQPIRLIYCHLFRTSVSHRQTLKRNSDTLDSNITPV